MNELSTTPDIRSLSSIGPEDALRVQQLFGRSLALELQDDRFDRWPTATEPGPAVEQPTALATVGNRVVGYLGGPIEGGRAELDALIDPELDDPVDLLDDLVLALADELHAAGAATSQIWGRPALPAHAELARRHGAAETRALHQMRCHLPVDIEPIESRDYRAHEDLDALRTVNNRAFSTHPDQGRETNESLLATMAEPWFRPGGLRIHEREGRVTGFCWTKIHPARTSAVDPGLRSEPLGEIYVIGIDPDFHGRGLGAPMTAAGLSWLNDQGLTTGMLYVEADNEPAVRTYERLGFTILRTDKAWSLPVGGS